MSVLDKDHFTLLYLVYLQRFMLNRIESKVYDLMANKNVAKLTSKFISGERDMDPQKSSFRAEKIFEFPLGEDPKQVQVGRNLAYVTSMKDATLDIFDITKGILVDQIKLPGMPVEVMIDSDRGYCLVSEMGKGSDGRNSVMAVDLKSRKILFRINTEGRWSKFMALRPHSTEVWVSNWLSDDISVLNLEGRTLTEKFSAGKTPRGLAFTPDGQFAYICGYYSRDVLKVDANSREVVKRIFMPFPKLTYQGTPRHIVIDTIGQFAYISNMGRGTVHKLDLSTDQIIATTYSGKRVATIDLTPDNHFLACANNGERCLTVIETDTFTTTAIIPTNGLTFGLDINQTGNKLVSATFNSRLLEVFNLKY